MKKALLTSYRVTCRFAIVKDLILPAAVEMAEILIGETEATKLKTINTIQRSISDMAEDI